MRSIFSPLSISGKGKALRGSGGSGALEQPGAGISFPYRVYPPCGVSGLINPIGSYVLREACAACKGWNDNGHPNYRVNVNLSVVQLLSEDIVEIIRKALRDSGLKAEESHA